MHTRYTADLSITHVGNGVNDTYIKTVGVSILLMIDGPTSYLLGGFANKPKYISFDRERSCLSKIARNTYFTFSVNILNILLYTRRP